MKNLPPVVVSLRDIRFMLDEAPYAALLVDRLSEEIILANQLFNQLVQLALGDVLGCKTSVFFGEIHLEGIPDGQTQYGTLVQKDRQPIQVQYSFHYFGNKDQYLFIKIIPLSQISESQFMFLENMQKQQIKSFLKLEKKDISNLLKELSAFVQKELNPDFTFFYYFDRVQDKLIRIPHNEKDLFPATIPAIEISKFQNVDHWEPGKRVLSEIHRAGRKNRINSLLTLPLISGEYAYGLFVIAYRYILEDQSIFEKAIILSNWIVSILNIYSKFEKICEAEREITQLLDRNHAILEILQDGYVILDDNFRIVEFNKPFQSLVGYSPVELMNKSLELFMSSTIAYKMKDKIIAKDLSSEADIIPILDREGNEIMTSVITNRIETNSGNQTILLFEDLDELINNRKKLEEVTKIATLGEVLADFAHEVRNPINNLTTGLQVLDRAIQQDQAQQDIIHRMQEDCIRMNYLMESVLAFSRQSVETHQEINLIELINRLLYRLKSKYSEKGVSLYFRSDIEQEKVTVFGDQRALEQVLINIINNAYDAIYEIGGVISVVVSNPHDHQDFYCVQIADTGPGIPKDLKSKIFEPFVSNKPGGTGLGLAIGRRIINAHNGWIDLETFPGGTIFNIYIPIFQ